VTAAHTRVKDAYAAIARVDRPEVWITRREQSAVEADVASALARAAAGENLPYAGLLFAVKDNIDVAGLPTTAGCPGFAHPVDTDATAVARLRAAGAVVLGKTNLDQFATGLVGTRSPYGAVRSALDPELISGGSSSGSAVAVALGIVDFALGTDTAGSGRVPAALQGIVGVKASVGLVPTTGVLPACRSLDCVTAFAPGLVLADSVIRTMSGPDGVDALARALPSDAPLAAPGAPVVAVPRAEDLTALDPQWRMAFDAHLARLRDAGVTLVEIDITPFLKAAALLYDGAFVAERYTAIGEILEARPEGLDPIVAGIVTVAGTLPAHRFAGDVVRLAELRLAGEANFAGAHAMLLPTTTHHPSLAEVEAAPIAVNSRLGTFTNFANLFGYAAYAVQIESGRPGANVGVQVLARPFADAVARDIAAIVQAVESVDAVGTLPAFTPAVETRGVDVLVVGAHLRGLPLHPRLRRHGALFLEDVRTARGYELVVLGDELNRPGMVRRPGSRSSVLGELWRVPETALSALLLEAAAPLGLGRVTLSDGREVVGYLCEAASANGKELVPDGDWMAYTQAPHDE
jgi:allophanate hydrolase